MSKRTWISIAVVTTVLAIGSIAYAATAVKYFNRIKETTVSGSLTVTVKQVSERVAQSRDKGVTSWTSGPVTPGTWNSCDSSGDLSTIEAGKIRDATLRKFTTTVTGSVPPVPSNQYPPIFFSTLTYYKNGKVFEFNISPGTKEYEAGYTLTKVYCDGHTVVTQGAGEKLPTAGSQVYTYKRLLYQASN
ncbi:MAG: hypothetical protein V1916_01850 [Patescibacteria group bacterium]